MESMRTVDVYLSMCHVLKNGNWDCHLFHK